MGSRTWCSFGGRSSINSWNWREDENMDIAVGYLLEMKIVMIDGVVSLVMEGSEGI